jgi:hypothetical protein
MPIRGRITAERAKAIPLSTVTVCTVQSAGVQCSVYDNNLAPEVLSRIRMYMLPPARGGNDLGADQDFPMENISRWRPEPDTVRHYSICL